MLFKKNRKRYSVAKKPIIPGLILLSDIIFGTLGYSYLWSDTDANIIDAIYMTFITITTVGYAEIYPLNDIGRIFTIIIGVTGIGSLFYILGIAMENLFIFQLENIRGKKKMMTKIDHLKNHIIVVGYGRVGQLAINELLRSKEEFVVIDDDFKESVDLEIKEQLLRVVGDATSDDVLIKAGINRAKGMIVTTANPATTVFVVLSAKVLNPNVFIVARCDEDSDFEKLKRAGSDKIVNPYAMGGQRLVNLMIKPNVIDFFETSFGSKEQNLSIESVFLTNKSHWINKSIKNLGLRQKVGATILAVIRDGNPYVNPDANFTLKEGDSLMVLGTKEQLKQLEGIS